MKKFITLILIIMFSANLPATAFSFKKKKQVNPLEYSEKVEYVNMGFFQQFSDPYLSEYICEAIKNNHEVRKASWQVEENRQNIKYSFGKELPHLSVSANYLGVHVPELDNFSLKTNAFLLPFIMTYEPDFLLKNRDKTKSVKKSYEATKFQEKSVYLSLAGDVAASYVNILEYDKLVELQQEIVNIKQEKLNRELKKFSRGTINNQSLNTAKTDLETEKATLNDLMKSRDTILNQFAVLIGVSPACIKDIKRGKFENFDYKGKVPDSVSSDVIFSRPDVMSAEKQLEKAKIDIRVARKEFLPSFRLYGIWAFNTIAPGSFFSWQSSLAAIVAGATQDIFMGGMKLATLRINKTKYEQMFENYKQTDLTALKEVNTALYIINYDTNTDNITMNKLKLQTNTYQDMERKFNRGVISYPKLLDEKAKVINAKQNKVQTKTTRLVNYFTLYKAVGGKL